MAATSMAKTATMIPCMNVACTFMPQASPMPVQAERRISRAFQENPRISGVDRVFSIASATTVRDFLKRSKPEKRPKQIGIGETAPSFGKIPPKTSLTNAGPSTCGFWFQAVWPKQAKGRTDTRESVFPTGFPPKSNYPYLHGGDQGSFSEKVEMKIMGNVT